MDGRPSREVVESPSSHHDAKIALKSVANQLFTERRRIVVPAPNSLQTALCSLTAITTHPRGLIVQIIFVCGGCQGPASEATEGGCRPVLSVLGGVGNH